jgi:hypothetical protein
MAKRRGRGRKRFGQPESIADPNPHPGTGGKPPPTRPAALRDPNSSGAKRTPATRDPSPSIGPKRTPATRGPTPSISGPRVVQATRADSPSSGAKFQKHMQTGPALPDDDTSGEGHFPHRVDEPSSPDTGGVMSWREAQKKKRRPRRPGY